MMRKQTQKKYVCVDGNAAVAYIGYALSDIACIYPITPSTPMAELNDEWSAKDKINIFGNIVKVVEMQSEAGVAGALHGAATSGALATTYTASQGLLLMIPNMYKIAGECLPVVFHVSSRSLGAQSLCIFGDHQDVMACRQTGFCMLASNNVQEAMDMALVAHISAIKSSLPFLHFFDGFRTSHEINKIEEISYDLIKEMLPVKELNSFRLKAHNPNHPKVTGTTQNDDTYFQSREANNILYTKVYDIVKNTMDELAKHTGRKYQPYEYYGPKDATDAIVVMCSGADTVQETIDVLNAKGNKYGLLKVRLFRPFNAQAFSQQLPKTVKRICVLDRTKESGSLGEPLYEDVALALNITNHQNIKLIGGRFGIGSKDFTPSNVVEIFDNLTSSKSKNHFTVGINDDITHASLKPLDYSFNLNNQHKECKFWGLGSDGTVSANKSSIKIIGESTNKYIQGYFEYDSKKSNGLTISHLRISNDPIKSHYYVSNADLIAIHKFNFIEKYDVLNGLKQNGIVLLNTIYSLKEIGSHLSDDFKKILIDKKAKLFIIDAYKLANKIGLGNKINVIMQACFFKITGIIDFKLAINKMKEAANKLYAKKGDKIINANLKAIDQAINELHQADPDEIAKAKYIPLKQEFSAEATKFYKDFCEFIAKHKGNQIPLSKFNIDGSVETGTTQYEKRNIANFIPEWHPENCLQCGQCTLICSHAALRAGAIKTEDLKDAPHNFNSKDALGIKGAKYTIQVSPLDCTGCGGCIKVCPAKNKALVMKPIEQYLNVANQNWNYFNKLNLINQTPFAQNTVKGIQFKQPYFEFNGACAGCGETPYIKAITQLYGDRMIIANATGCSSIFGGASPTVPYTKDKEGRGPSWSNSLFEDNAEYGYGIALANKLRRNDLYNHLNNLLNKNISSEFKNAIKEMIAHKEDEHNQSFINNLIDIAKKQAKNDDINKLLVNQDQLSKKSVWIIGGDGWAYDIGFGGLDHVLASGENLNILVLDTEVYSNTGGQASKATPMGSVAKFAAGGKATRKKDLGAIAMTYKDVYVAQVAMGANPHQFLKVISEAEAYNGVSLIIAYAPCINHGINMSETQLEQAKAVNAGYWQLYRYNPALASKKLTLDSPDPKGNYQEFLKGEARYMQLIKKNPSKAQELFTKSEDNAKQKWADLKIKEENS